MIRIARKAIGLVMTASLALSAGGWAWVAPAAAARSEPSGGRPLAIRLGQTRGLTHIDFPGEAPSASRREGADLVLVFRHAAPSADVARLRIEPIGLVTAVKTESGSAGLELRLTLADGVEAKLGRVDGVPAVTLLTPPTAEAPAATPGGAGVDQRPAARPDPAPQDGRVKVGVQQEGAQIALSFPWRAPLGAAVFRRGDALWMVFDAKAAIDLPAKARAAGLLKSLTVVEGEDFVAVRMQAPPTVLASAVAVGGTWTLTLGPTAAAPSTPVKMGRDDQSGAPVLTAEVAGATGVFWVTDPGVGDKLAVVTALPPAKGAPKPRALVDADVLESEQGLALVPTVDDLQVSTDGDVVRIGRPRGLALSPPRPAGRPSTLPAGLPQPAAMPALVDFDGWSRTGSAGFLARYDQLETMAADEEGKGKAGGVAARMALARFLVGSELSFEALGILAMAAKADQTLQGDPEFRGLRGAARAMAGRLKEAQADFSAPVLADDPASALWRSYLAERLGDHAGARQQFALGRPALALFTERWRGRFKRYAADAALAVNDVAAARLETASAAGLKLDPEDALGIKLDQARLLDAQGQVNEALTLYDQVAADSYGGLAAPAALRSVQIRLQRGQISPGDAEAQLDSLRFRWRGDATELETVRALGRLYLSQGRYREALEVLRSANGRLPDLPASVGITTDLSDVFKALFLNGQADGLQPIQALALFYDFKDLTPIGADGDEMVRKLSRRLVDVDLLDQAAELLKYQVDNRLDGVPKAEVSTDLAMIDLMNKKPEDALDAINNSRTTLLPAALNQRRRLIQARALVSLGRFDDGLELLLNDKTAEAEGLRAEIAWRQKNWGLAGPKYEAELGDRWKTPGPLTGEEQGELVRAGTAYSMAGDDKSLARLRQHYGRLADSGSAPNAVKVALDGVDGTRLTPEDFARAVSQTEVFAGWLDAMKKRFAAEPSPFTGAAAAPARAAGVGPPPQGRAGA